MEWEEKFDEFVKEKNISIEMDGLVSPIKEMKSFIKLALESQMSDLRKEVEKMKEGLMTDNNGSTTCNSRCHDSGKETALDEVLLLMKK